MKRNDFFRQSKKDNRVPIGFKTGNNGLIVPKASDEDYEEDFEDFDAEEFEEDYEDYDHFDSSEAYEDYAKKQGGGMRVKRAKQSLFQGLSQINLKIINAGAGDVKVELFNSIRSISKMTNLGVSPFLAFSPADRNAANLNSRIYFNDAGDLIFQDSAGALTTISCREIPYRALVESTMSSPFMVAKMRVAYSNDSQIDQNFAFTQNSFMGKKKEDSINPRSFFDPKQNQNLIVDVKQSFRVDRESGLIYTVEAGQNIRATLYIPRARKAGMKV